ncbi:MAG: C45 family autoproteolytic acyltransferase/hydrolase [Thermodesulfobacteriota bacterium]
MLPIVSLKGTPKEIGSQYGSACREMIKKNIDLYFRLFKYYANLNYQQACQLAQSFIPVIQKFDPELIEEIEGIAAGAGVAKAEVLAINVRTELMYPDKLAPGGECTSIAALPPATLSGEVLIGQNWDWKPHLKETTVILEIEQINKPKVITLTEAGVVGKIGCNSAGLGACLNILKAPVEKIGLPIHILMRGILNSSRMGDAIAKIVAMDRGSANNCLLAHRDGLAMDFEMAPLTLDFFYPQNGVLMHTNHFNSDLLKPLEGNIVQYPDTLLRYGIAQQKLSARIGKITSADFQEVFRDHFNFPNGICRHPDEREHELAQAQTVVSIIMNLTKKEIYVAEGPPCQGEYRTLNFSGL